MPVEKFCTWLFSRAARPVAERESDQSKDLRLLGLEPLDRATGKRSFVDVGISHGCPSSLFTDKLIEKVTGDWERESSD